jgi:hypothetical protein
LKDQRVDGRMGSIWTLRRLARGVWSGFTWLRIGTVGGLLWMRWWTFGFWRHGVKLVHEHDFQHIYTPHDATLPERVVWKFYYYNCNKYLIQLCWRYSKTSAPRKLTTGRARGGRPKRHKHQFD